MRRRFRQRGFGGWAAIDVLSIAIMSFSGAPSMRASGPGTDLVVMLDMGMDATQRGAYNLPSQNIINSLAGGARVAAMELRPDDRVSLVTFSEKAKIVLPMTADTGKFESALRRAGEWVVQNPQRRLFDSLLTAIDSFQEAPRPGIRRCVLVLTTMSDSGSRHSADEVVDAARSKSVTIFVALISAQRSPGRGMGPVGQPSPRGLLADEDEEKRMLAPVAKRAGGDVRVYSQSPYVTARAIDEMINQ